MGYRSEVGIKCDKKAYGMFKEEIKKFNGFYPDIVYECDGDYIMLWKWVKWYDEYHEVKTIEDIMDKLDSNTCNREDGGHYHFIRIGEDYDDTDERFNEFMNLYITRTIDAWGNEVDF